MPRGSAPVSPTSAVCASAHQSERPSPGCWRLVRQFTFAGPPTRRLEMPCPYSWNTMPASRSPSRSGFGLVQTNICMRGRWPSGGVPKFALFVPAPSCASARTESLPSAAATVVVDLEVTAGLVEAVLVLHVVNEVVQVEQVGHRGRAISARRLRQVQREVEGEPGAAARTGIRVRRIVGVHVRVGLDVVALGRGELGPGSAIRVMPAEGRCRRVGRVHDQDAAVRGRQRARMVGTFRGLPVHAVLVAGDPVEARPHLTGIRVDRVVPGVLFVERMNLEIPHQARFALADGQQHQLAVDRRERNAGVLDARDLHSARCLQRLRLRRERSARELRSRADSCGQLRARRKRADGACHTGQERVVDADDAAVTIHVDVQLCVVHGDAAMTLLQVDVRGPGRLRVDDVRDCIALQVGGFESERCDVVANEAHRERHRRAARFVGEIAALTR